MSRSLLGKKPPKTNISASATEQAKDALFGLSRNAPHLVEVPVDKVVSNPSQPRRHFDEDDLQGLAASIERHGLQQPIGVRQIADDRWQLVYGERRLRAMKLLGRDTVFGILFAGDDDEEVAIVENLQRSDLTPVEESDALARLAERHGYSHRELADALGRKKTYVTMMLALQKLAPIIREEYATVRPTKSKLEAIAAIEDQGDQIRAWETLKKPEAPLPSPMTEGPAVDDVDGNNEKPPREQRSSVGALAGIALSALPKRAAKPVFQARDVLVGLRDQPQTLANVDRDVLHQIRDAIDAILADADAPVE